MTLKQFAMRMTYSSVMRALEDSWTVYSPSRLIARIAFLLRYRWDEIVSDMYDAEEEAMQEDVLRQNCEMVALLVVSEVRRKVLTTVVEVC